MTILTARGLSVGHGGRVVLGSVDLDLGRESLAVLGRNGSGKTTLLRALAGLIDPMAGRLRWSGEDLPELAERPQAIGVLLQEEPPTAFGVSQMVTFGLGLDRPPDEAQRRVVERCLQRYGLVPLAGRPCTALSGGEWRRTLLARATVASPALLLLDEPTNHLDPEHRAALLSLLTTLDCGMIIATHDLELASRCDRVMLLADAGVYRLGPASSVLTPEHLGYAMGVHVRVVTDPADGATLLRIVGSVETEVSP